MRWPCSKGLSKLGEPRMFFVGGMDFILNGIGRDNIDKVYGFGGGFLGG